jgi:hypothetical protein
MFSSVGNYSPSTSHKSTNENYFAAIKVRLWNYIDNPRDET